MVSAKITSSSDSNPAPPPPSFSLSPSHLARLQPHTYVLAHLQPTPSSARPSVRISGRTKSQFRPASVHPGSLTHTNGSAVVRIGDTTAVCGVRAEVLSTEDIPGWKVTSSLSPSALEEARGPKRQKTDSSSVEDDSDSDDNNSEIQALNLLVPNLSLSTGCSPSITAGAPPTALAQSLSHQILSLLHSSRLVRAEDLRIWYNGDPNSKQNDGGEGDVKMGDDTDAPEQNDLEKPEIKAFWTLYIDVLLISLAGNPFDAAWAAVYAALQDTRLPKAWWDIDNETVLCSDSVSDSMRLNLRGMPVSSSFSVFEAHALGDWRRVFLPFDQQKGKGRGLEEAGDVDKWILADPDAFEESLCSERICVVVDKDRSRQRVKILRLEKNGGFFVGKAEMKELVELSASRWEEWRLLLKDVEK